ncbi:MAG: stage V sporulation protein AA [Defluviitaleaceae bacterium]|nr:stage V sporulation protein AA [Defluviitaleaceae bacterium]
MSKKAEGGVEIYIKPKKKAHVAGDSSVCVVDVADVLAEDGLKKRVEGVKLLPAPGDRPQVISVLDMVAAITAALPGHTVVNLGEMDTIVVAAHPAKKSKLWAWVKVALVSVVLFTGSITAIMTFHTDSQLATVFQNYHRIFFGETSEKPYIITIPYSIGLGLGIMVFFNRFAGKKITSEPTPIEVEMETYEKDVEDALIERIGRHQQGQEGDKP